MLHIPNVSLNPTTTKHFTHTKQGQAKYLSNGLLLYGALQLVLTRFYVPRLMALSPNTC